MAKPRAHIEDYIQKGLHFLGNGQVEEARQCWINALKIDPYNSKAKEYLHYLESQYPNVANQSVPPEEEAYFPPLPTPPPVSMPPEDDLEFALGAESYPDLPDPFIPQAPSSQPPSAPSWELSEPHRPEETQNPEASQLSTRVFQNPYARLNAEQTSPSTLPNDLPLPSMDNPHPPVGLVEPSELIGEETTFHFSENDSANVMTFRQDFPPESPPPSSSADAYLPPRIDPMENHNSPYNMTQRESLESNSFHAPSPFSPVGPKPITNYIPEEDLEYHFDEEEAPEDPPTMLEPSLLSPQPTTEPDPAPPFIAPPPNHSNLSQRSYHRPTPYPPFEDSSDASFSQEKRYDKSAFAETHHFDIADPSSENGEFTQLNPSEWRPDLPPKQPPQSLHDASAPIQAPSPTQQPHPSSSQSLNRATPNSDFSLPSWASEAFAKTFSPPPHKHPPTHPPAPPQKEEKEKDVQILLEGIRELIETQQFDEAIELLDVARQSSPHHPEIKELFDLCQSHLITQYRAEFADLMAIPRLLISPQQLTKKNFDNRIGFIISQLDGRTSVQDLLLITGFDEFELLKTLSLLLKQNVISI